MQVQIISLVGTDKVVREGLFTLISPHLEEATAEAEKVQLVDPYAGTTKMPYHSRESVLKLNNIYVGEYRVDTGDPPYCSYYTTCLIHEFISQIIFTKEDKKHYHTIEAGEVHEEKYIYVITPK